MRFFIERMTDPDAGAVAALIREVWNQMDRKEWYVPDDEEELSRVMEMQSGLFYGASQEGTGTLAAILYVLLPGLSEKNLGRDLGFSEKMLTKTAHIESVATLPEFRGNGLQGKLLKTAEGDLAQMGYRYLLSTVHPDNHFSRDNLLRQGFRAVLTKEKYGGLMRDILCKEIGTLD